MLKSAVEKVKKAVEQVLHTAEYYSKLDSSLEGTFSQLQADIDAVRAEIVDKALDAELGDENAATAIRDARARMTLLEQRLDQVELARANVRRRLEQARARELAAHQAEKAAELRRSLSRREELARQAETQMRELVKTFDAMAAEAMSADATRRVLVPLLPNAVDDWPLAVSLSRMNTCCATIDRISRFAAGIGLLRWFDGGNLERTRPVFGEVFPDSFVEGELKAHAPYEAIVGEHAAA